MKKQHTESALFPDFLKIKVEAEETVYKDIYSNNGAGPMWCYGNTCIVRLGADVFVSATERLPEEKPLNDCRWALLKRRPDGWERLQADEGRQREPCPLGCLPPDTVVLSSNPTLLEPGHFGGGPARPELVLFSANVPVAPGHRLSPDCRREDLGFSEHSYRSMAVDAKNGEIIVFQDVGLSHSEWALRDKNGNWMGGKLGWPTYVPGDLSPYGAAGPRVHYGQVVLRDRAVHYSGCAAYDNWDRVHSLADMELGLDQDKAPGMKSRQLGNRMRRFYYTWTSCVGEKAFCDWIEIDNTFADGGWLFPGDMHVDAAGTVDLLWYRAPMLRTLRDSRYPDIARVYSIEHARVRDGKIILRQTLALGGEGYDEAVFVDLDREGMTHVCYDGGWVAGDPLATPRFHVTPDGRLFVVYYVCDGKDLSENRIMEIYPDGLPSEPRRIPMQQPLTQFFTATPRVGCAPSWTLDMLGHRRGDWRHREGSDLREYEGTTSYTRVNLCV